MANEGSWQKRILAGYVRFVSEGRELPPGVENQAMAARDVDEQPSWVGEDRDFTDRPTINTTSTSA